MSAQVLRNSEAIASTRTRATGLALEESLWWTFRLAVAMCYIGHGAFGLITKAEWLPFFALVGISTDVAYLLMPMIGTVDIALGLSVLFSPRRAVLAYMVVWAVWTAALRPLTGLSGFELLERAGNYGVPLAFLLFLGPVRQTTRDWFAAVTVPVLTPERLRLVRLTLSWTTALLLVGHGGLAAIEQKPLLAAHAAVVGLPASAAVMAGWFEIALAGAVLLFPRVWLMIGIVVWKVGTEMLFPLSGASIWEWVERGGSYGAPLALAFILARGSGVARGAGAARSRGASRVAGMAAALLASTIMATPAGAQDAGPLASLAEELRRGGYVLVCRHAITDHGEHDRGTDRASQRNLTEEGVAQAKRIGKAIRDLRIPIGEVLSNPMYRNRETAEYAFGTMEVDSELAGNDAWARVRELASAAVRRGTNRALVTRTGILMKAFKGHDVGPIEEGDCVVTEPLGEGEFRVKAKLDADDWAELAEGRGSGSGNQQQ